MKGIITYQVNALFGAQFAVIFFVSYGAVHFGFLHYVVPVFCQPAVKPGKQSRFSWRM